jgi:hypothetical protein
MSSKITQLSALPEITASDYLVVARSTNSTNYSLPVQSVFTTLTNIGHTSPLYLIDAISSTNVVSQRGLKSASPILTLTLDTISATKNIKFDIVEEEIDLSLCDNSTSAFLTEVDLTTATGVLPVANGGTGLSSLTAKSVLITQDSGTSTLTATPMTTNGSLVIGGVNGPAVGTLTAGNNVSITNGDGSISIASSFTVATANVDMAGYNIDMSTGWISNDGANGGLTFGDDKIYVGESSGKFLNSSINVDAGITFAGGKAQTLSMLPTSVAGELQILGPGTNGSNSNGGNTTITGGNATGSGTGGDLQLIGGSSVSGTGGSVTMSTYVAGTLTEALTVAGNAKVSVNENDFEVLKTGKGIALPTGSDTQASSFTESVEINEVSGKITLYGGALSAGTQTQFTVTNSTVTTTSRILLTVEGPGASLETDNSIIIASLGGVSNGSFDVVLTNIGGANTDTRSRKIHFLVIK